MYYLIDHNWDVVQEASNFNDLDQEPYFGTWFTVVKASSKEKALKSGGAPSMAFVYEHGI